MAIKKKIIHRFLKIGVLPAVLGVNDIGSLIGERVMFIRWKQNVIRGALF
jgi:hypothetical protein